MICRGLVDELLVGLEIRARRFNEELLPSHKLEMKFIKTLGKCF